MTSGKIQFGKVHIPEPCLVPWNSMDPAEGRDKFCRECKKVVHNITGMAPDAILQLLQSDPGNICVNFVESHLPKDTETKFPIARKSSVGRFKYAVASAAMLLMMQQAQAAPFAKPTVEWTIQLPTQPTLGPTNTLVSGIVLDQNGNAVPEEMDVIITCGDVEVMRLMTRGGLFSCDLAGHISPEDSITISILPGPQSASKVGDAPAAFPEGGLPPVSTCIVIMDSQGQTQPAYWSNGKTTLRLADAQNVSITVDYQAQHYYPFQQMGGSCPPQSFYQVLPASFQIDYGKITWYVQPSVKKTQDQSCTDH